MELAETVDVFHGESVLGRISVYNDCNIGFAYEPAWISADDSFPLSVTLPLTEGPFPSEAIAPWLDNLLPEGGLRTRVAAAVNLPESDFMEILKKIGGDTAGAISVGSPSVRKDWRHQSLRSHYQSDSEEGALSRHIKDLKRRPFLVGVDGTVRLSLAGGEEKTILSVIDENGKPKLGLPTSADRLAIPKGGAPSTIIVKPNNMHFDGNVENEAYCLTLASLIGIPAAECAVLKMQDGNALAVARYDRCTHDDGSIQRLHQEDFAQANGAHSSKKYEIGTDAGLSLQKLLSVKDDLPESDISKLIDQIIFNILVANTDAHAKNYSIMHGRTLRLAPMYDVSSALLWPIHEQNHAQKIAGKKRKPGYIAKRHWESIARDAGLSEHYVLQQVLKQVDRMATVSGEAIRRVANQPGTSEIAVKYVASLVDQNVRRIAGRIR